AGRRLWSRQSRCLAGIDGQGQRNFIRPLAGLDVANGEIEMLGQAVQHPTPRNLRARGIGFLPDDRHREGLFLELTIAENIGLGIDSLRNGWRLADLATWSKVAEIARASFRIRTPSVSTAMRDLSGGNQQKVALARELGANPLVLLADEPTKGVDVAARADIYAMLRSHAERGNAVVVLSSDAQELAGVCDRVVVFSQNAICSELDGENVSQDSILEASLHARTARVDRAAERASSRGTVVKRFAPTVLLLLGMLAIAAIVITLNPLFLNKSNLTSMLTFAAILGCLAASQLSVVLLGGVDLSLGPLAGLVVVIASFLMTDAASPGTLLAWGAVIVAGCALFASAQAFFVPVFSANAPASQGGTLASAVPARGFRRQQPVIRRVLTHSLRPLRRAATVTECAITPAGGLAVATRHAIPCSSVPIAGDIPRWEHRFGRANG
ncbi:ATP-binding cassette domain-containing protein, partial [Mesorhizobium intechi]